MKLSVQQVKDILASENFTVIKYIKVNEEFRFAKIDISSTEHKDMLNAGEVAQSAGFCTLDAQSKHAHARGESISLKIGVDDGDSEKIAALLF